MEQVYVVERTIYGMKSTCKCLLGCFTTYEKAFNAALKFFNLNREGYVELHYEEGMEDTHVCTLEDNKHTVVIHLYDLDEYLG